MSGLVEFTDNQELITLAEVKSNLRLDDDLTEDDFFIESVLIPSARQMVETKAGAILRLATYELHLPEISPGDSVTLPHTLVNGVTDVKVITSGGSEFIVSADNYRLLKRGKEVYVRFLDEATIPSADNSGWVCITYAGGCSREELSEQYPSVKAYMLMLINWMFDNRSLFILSHGRASFSELPSWFGYGLLDPITLTPRL